MKSQMKLQTKMERIMKLFDIFSRAGKDSQKPIVLNCYTPMPHAAKYAQIQSGKNFFPKWWKALPVLDTTKDMDKHTLTVPTNMRNCTGFIDLYRNSVVVPLWSDLAVEIGSNEASGFRYQFSDGASFGEYHPSTQFKGFVDPDTVQHFKPVAPWHIECDEDINWVAVPPTYNIGVNDYVILPGVVNFQYMHAVNPQLLFHRPPQGSKIVTLAHGTPLYMYIPMSNRPVEVRTHLVSEQDYELLQDAVISFTRAGMQRRKLFKKQEGQCPFTHPIKKANQ